MKTKSISPQKRANTPTKPQEPKELKQEKSIATKANVVSHRFSHYQPQAIDTMALSEDGQLMAVARANGSIEVWLTKSWTELLVIAGNKNCPVRKLHWLELTEDRMESDDGNPFVYTGKQRRLISTGLNGVVCEWDFLQRSIKHLHTVHSPIWDSKLVGKFLYLACEDGSIRVLKVKKQNFEHARSFTKAETKCLCLEVTADGKAVFAGYADSSVRRWELETGDCTLHFQKATKASQQSICMIWCLRLFASCVITGDSQGDLSVWDSQHGTLLKQFNQLKADILQIEVHPQYGMIYATGVDSRILSVQLDRKSDQWVFLGLFRGQSHDIKALVRIGNDQLISAGNTTDMCVYKLKQGTLSDQYGKDSEQQQHKTKLRHIAPFPFTSPVHLSDDLLLMQNSSGTTLEVWQCKAKQKVLNLNKKGDYLVQERSLCEGFIAYSDCKDTQVFHFDQSALQLTKLTAKLCQANQLKSLPAAQKLALSKNEDGQMELLLVDTNLQIFVANLKTFSFKCVITSSAFAILGELRPIDRIVRVCHVNPLTRKVILALADPSHLLLIDLACSKLEWRLPAMQDCGFPLSVTSDAQKAVVAYDTNKIVVFDTLNSKLHEWTKSNLQNLPKNFLDRYNRLIGVVAVSESKFVLYSNYTYSVLDLHATVPETVEIVQNHPGKCIEGKQCNASGWADNLKLSQAKYLSKRETTAVSCDESAKNLAISNKYKGILLMTWSLDTLTVVENSWQQSVKQFQAGAFITKKFKK